MKIKLLLAPSLVVGSLILLIWFVYPAYTSPIAVGVPAVPGEVSEVTGSGAKEKYARVQEANNKLKTIDAKIAKSESLSSQIRLRETNDGLKTAVETFIPDSMNEEGIIDILNFLAGKQGLSVANISVSPVKTNSVQVNTSSTNSLNPETAGLKKVTPGDIEVDFTAIGGYAQIKEFLGKVYAMKRYNRISSLDIAPAVNATGDQNTGMLQLVLTVNFNMLPKFTDKANPEESIFADGQNLNMSVAEMIKKVKDTEVSPLETGDTGVENPFLP
jgi:hypothetical protein